MFHRNRTGTLIGLGRLAEAAIATAHNPLSKAVRTFGGPPGHFSDSRGV